MNTPGRIEQGEIPFAPMDGLHSRVSRLSASVPLVQSGQRLLPGRDAPELLSGLLAEIDETVLPREIKVMNGSGRIMRLHVRARRLLQILHDDKMADTQIGPCDAKVMGETLRTFLGDSSRATFEVTRASFAHSSCDGGCSVAALARGLSVNPDRATGQDPIPGFLASLQDTLIARVTLDSAALAVNYSGDQTWCERLGYLCSNGLPEMETQMCHTLADPAGPGCIMLNYGSGTGFLLVYARSGTSGFVAILPASELGSVQSSWRACFT